MESLVEETRQFAEKHLAANPTDIVPVRNRFEEALRAGTEELNRHLADKTRLRWLLQLYQNYVDVEVSKRQFKAAKAIFERATAVPSLRADTAVWLAYATFFITRNKSGSTRKVFLNGIKSVSTEDARNTLWDAFLKFENKGRFIPLTMLQLEKLLEESGSMIAKGLSSPRAAADTKKTAPSGASTSGSNDGRKGPSLVDPSLFVVPEEEVFFLSEIAERKKSLPPLRQDTMMNLAAMFKFNPDCLFEIVLKMKELQGLIVKDLRVQGKIFQEEIKIGKRKVEDLDFRAAASKELRRTRRHMQSLLHEAGVPGVFLTEDGSQIIYQQKILSVVIDAAVLQASRKRKRS